MDVTRIEVRELMTSLHVTQASLRRHINGKCGYTVTAAEVCDALNGSLVTPKANRILADAWSYLKKTERRA